MTPKKLFICCIVLAATALGVKAFQNMVYASEQARSLASAEEHFLQRQTAHYEQIKARADQSKGQKLPNITFLSHDGSKVLFSSTLCGVVGKERIDASVSFLPFDGVKGVNGVAPFVIPNEDAPNFAELHAQHKAVQYIYWFDGDMKFHQQPQGRMKYLVHFVPLKLPLDPKERGLQ